MAIKLPDPGNGIPEQKTGNDEWTNMKIVRDNFADQSNAASRLVGTANGQIPLAENVLEAMAKQYVALYKGDIDDYQNAQSFLDRITIENPEKLPNKGQRYYFLRQFYKYATSAKTQVLVGVNDESLFYRSYDNRGGDWTWKNWVEVYTSANTTKDGNGFLKASSPVVDLYDNKIELNGDAETQGVEFIKNDTGDYTLKTKTGLRSDNTWQIEIPQDNNKNPLFAVDIDAQDDGTINIKCYKRIFSMETFLFGPDLESPVDITDGRFISVRLNDNPEPEQLDEPTI